ncbi:type I-F CRISPR-associated protein Csy1 [Methylomicrobium album]|uniref:CRISPR type I-F/YPEST-associated protein Csy1 n=1 Tax=Methylomicrobium album BG8 TaxID=686340 RepID=H8GLE6_METAL|nr:type I-F CRISPR-associated protein Csy1 [Methylomicrobium album]EIC29311.1 CRISPR type I-F/YPEST-associated protein Csy1 [Methylomicrobium album BG8]
MLDPAIQSFLTERKAAWLKDKLKSAKTEFERQDVETKADEKFAPENWIPDAAKRAAWLSIVSHSGKFTHPGVKISPVISTPPHKRDGYLRSGNADADFDVFGNAAALDVFKFLSLPLSDGQTVLEHLEQNSELIRRQFNLAATSFAELQKGLMAIKPDEIAKIKTSEKIKQVYFPIEGGYHLLSILTPSGLMFKLKERINAMRFSEQAKQARDDRRNQAHNEHGCDEIYNLAAIGFGGTKPQNISVLNNQNGGIAYLLPSLPPVLAQRVVRRPKSSFFKDSLYFKPYREEFLALHRLFMAKPNNIDIRDGRDDWIISIAERVLETVGQLRQETAGWSENTRLPLAQKIWLDSAFDAWREQEDEWLAEIIVSLADWFRIAYRNVIGAEKAIALGDDELKHIRKVLGEHEELLR